MLCVVINKKQITTVLSVKENGRLQEMCKEDIDSELFGGENTQAEAVLVEICARIEKMCRYGQLSDKEADEQTMKDRNIVEGLYYSFKKKGDDKETAAIKSRTGAIKLVIKEAFL